MSVARDSQLDRAAAFRRVFLGPLAANVAVVAAQVVSQVRTGSRSVLGDAILCRTDTLNNLLPMAHVEPC